MVEVDDKASNDEAMSAGSTSTHPDHHEMSMPSINDSWFGKPVEEVDPLIFEDVCLLISKCNLLCNTLECFFSIPKANFFVLL